MNTLAVNINIPLPQQPLCIDIEFPLQGIIGIFGHSGSGKTSLLKAIAGINSTAIGTITLGGNSLQNSASNQFIKPENRHIVGVFQQDGLFPHLSVKQNLLYARKRCQKPTLDIEDIIARTGITQLLTQSIDSLSGGERQKVAIARALLAEPKLLILDEPVTALDKINRASILSLIKSLQRQYKLSILYVSHNLEEIQALAHRLVVISAGKVLHHGDTHQVIHELNHSELIDQQTSLNMSITHRNQAFGLAALSWGSDHHLLALDEHIAGDNQQTIRCYILARDISVSTEEPAQSSIVNHVQGVISTIDIKEHQVLLTVECDGQNFYASISSYSLEKLSLACQSTVYLQFKASAIRQII